MATIVFAIAAGGALGSLLRWLLGLRLNPVPSGMPLGTLAANLIAGYAVGLAVAFFARHPWLPPAWRLFLITGVLGGLSTFSSFSAEVTAHLQAGRWGWAATEIAVHVVGSVALTLLGIATYALLER